MAVFFTLYNWKKILRTAELKRILILSPIFYRVSLLPLFRWDERLMKGAVGNAVAFPLQWSLNDLKEMQGLGGAW